MSDTTTQAPAAQDENQLMLERREKLKALRQRQQDGGAVAFPNDFKPTHQAEALFFPPPGVRKVDIAGAGGLLAGPAAAAMLDRLRGRPQ